MATNMGSPLRRALVQISDDAGVNVMKERESEFSSPLAAQLAGVAVLPDSRVAFDASLNVTWAEQSERRLKRRLERPNLVDDEVVIGAGIHAAIYCAARARVGARPPLVIDSAARPGGSFACSTGPSFYLNSRNRPGGLGIPGDGAALNFLPGAPVQPSDLSGAEYQRNNDLAFVIRSTLAMHARVMLGVGVMQVERNAGVYELSDKTGQVVARAQRVIDARGIGFPKLPAGFGGSHMVTFMEFMARMDSLFPMRGLRRVAVVGGGDSGRTALEALVGEGPAEHWSVPSLDWIETIDWYGKGLPTSCEGYLAASRTRYKGLSGCLPRNGGGGTYRIQPFNCDTPGVPLSPGFDSAVVGSRSYDLVIACTGYRNYGYFAGDEINKLVMRGDRAVARQVGPEHYAIGPHAQIAATTRENAELRLAKVPENRNAVFRYADRTATFAAMLGKPGQPTTEKELVEAPRVTFSPNSLRTLKEIVAQQAKDARINVQAPNFTVS